MAAAARDLTGPDYASLIQPDRVHGSLYTDRLRLVDGELRLAGQQVVLAGRDQPLPTLAVLI